MNQRRKLLLLFFILTSTLLSAQQTLLPSMGNAVLKQYNATHPNLEKSYQIKNILAKTNAALDSLPFFEDFSSSNIVTDTNKWLDHNVYINNGFPINPPSYNVATFDGLDKLGNAYSLSTAGTTYGPADTLTSVPRNLANYTAASNVYFSFFYEKAGLGDMPQLGDSLLLQFLTTGGKWNTVWSKNGGNKETQFTQVLLPINSSIYLHGAFQFRFINYGSYTGNWNCWHIDYIRIESQRSPADSLITDVAIMSTPTPLLKNYYRMPWTQFKAAVSKERSDSSSFYVRNLKNTNVQVPSKYFTFNKHYNNLISNDFFTLGSLTYQTPKRIAYPFNVLIDTLQPFHDSITIKSLYTASENSDVRRTNDSFYKEQLFANYYAYDDGTAENGFGILNGSGKVAIQFETNTPDTLRAIDIYFNQSGTTNAGINFTLTVWSAISPVGQPTTQDKKLHSQTVLVPAHDYSYRDQMQGFVRYTLDTPRYLPTGKFYIGWVQNSNYQLNVGYDFNYPENFKQPFNPNVFVNTLGSWMVSGSQPGFTGTPMLRPVVGNLPVIPAGIKQENKQVSSTLSVYPNPAHTLLYVGVEASANKQFQVIDTKGKSVKSGNLESEVIDVQDLPAGIYFITITDILKNQTYSTKFIIQ